MTLTNTQARELLRLLDQELVYAYRLQMLRDWVEEWAEHKLTIKGAYNVTL